MTVKTAQYSLRMLNLLRHWPAVCEVCDRWPSQTVCQPCRQRHAPVLPRCPGCALPLAPGLHTCVRCVESPASALDRCLARVDYTYPWVNVIAEFKFKQQPAWAGHLAKLMLEDELAQELLHSADLIAPIPLPASRLRERGYNQAWELARHLHSQTSAAGEAVPDLLLRAETIHTQHDLPRHQRFEHAQQVLSGNPARTQHISNAHVLLIDDVMTTGATLQAAATLLRFAGAASVKALVFARTPVSVNME